MQSNTQPNTEQGQIALSRGAFRLTLAPQAGASILRFDYQPSSAAAAIPLFRPYQGPSFGTINSGDTGYFPLVPFSNRIRAGVLHWQGRQYSLPLNMPPQPHALHGSGWQSPWHVVDQSAARVLLSLDNPCPQWPFAYRAQQALILTECGLHIDLSITNTGTCEMPAGLGFHPFFSRTPAARLSADLPQMWAVDADIMPKAIIASPFATPSAEASANGNADPRPLPQIRVAEHQLDNPFGNFRGQAKILWPEWSLSATIRATETCGFLVIYSPKDADFFCVEPVTHITDGFNQFAKGEQTAHATGTVVLQPGATLAATMTIDIQPV